MRSKTKCELFAFILKFYFWIHHLVRSEILLHGSGATFPAEVYEAWMPVFQYERENYIQIDVEFEERGSGAGKTVMAVAPNASRIQYGATDSPLTEEEKSRDPDLIQVPAVAGSVVLAYNLPTVPNLVLSRDEVVAIYDGSIHWWNDTRFMKLNPNATFPNVTIKVVARADYSGTTEIFTAALSSFSEEWNRTKGIFAEGQYENETSVYWNDSVISLWGRTNRGVSGIIVSYRHSIGYISFSEALLTTWTIAEIQNKFDVTTSPLNSNIDDVMYESLDFLNDDLTAYMVDSNVKYAYPIYGYSYLIIRLTTMIDCDEAVELYNYIQWSSTNDFAEELATELGTAQVIPEIASLVQEKILDYMSCNGHNVNELATEKKLLEQQNNGVVPWKISVYSLIIVFSLLFIGLTSYIVMQQLKLRRAVLSDEWRITSSDITIRWDRQRGRLLSKHRSRLFTQDSGRSSPAKASTIAGLTISDSSNIWTENVAKLGIWGGKTVSLRILPTENEYSLNITKRDTKLVALTLRNKVVHNNILRFYGVAFFDDNMYFVSEQACKGSVKDIIYDSKYNLDVNFKFSIALDIASGMEFLHNHHIIHSRLTADCCLLDTKWNVKITDWEFYKLHCVENKHKKPSFSFTKQRISLIVPADILSTEKPAFTDNQRHFWTAPEILKEKTQSSSYTYKSDVYSFGMVLYEIFTGEEPFSDKDMSKTMILQKICNHELKPAMSTISPNQARQLTSKAIATNPIERPPFYTIMKDLQAAKPNKKSVIESMMETLEGYVLHLEDKVEERTAELATANDQLQRLLHQILPASVADCLSRGVSVEPEHYESVSIFFSDIVGFTTLCASSTPMDVVTFLNDLYTTFDTIIDQLDVYKVETIGDSYMVISGAPIRNEQKHAAYIADMALQLIDAVSFFTVAHKPDTKIQMRAGVHSGSVAAGVVGVKMPRYCLFGDSVNTASRLESTSLPMKIQISTSTNKLLQKIGGYATSTRGQTQLKGKGWMTTYFLENRVYRDTESDDSTQN